MPEKLTSIPDVTGYSLDKAKKIIKKAEAGEIDVIMTSVPSYKQAQYRSGSLESVRVLRQEASDDGKAVKLTVCELFK